MWIAVIVALVVVAALLVLQFRSGKTTAPVDIEALERASDSEVTPFTVHVEEEVLDDLRTRLSLSRYPPEQEGVGWEAGAPVDVIRDLASYWKDEYDWRRHEAAMNELPHFKTRIGDVDLHFIHARSSRADATPLLMIHGWPGSFYEFHKMIGPLTEPEKHGRTSETPAFHVIVPSLPGYGFSSAYPRHLHGDIKQVAITCACLMRRLRYEAYICQGGDWGGLASSYVPLVDPDHCKAVHLNFLVAEPKTPLQFAKAIATAMFGTAQEKADLAAVKEFQKTGCGYSAVQRTKPQTLAFGLTDSPLGLLAWIGEKFYEWSDCNGNLQNSFSYDEIITNVMLYWVSGTIASSTRLYYETERAGRWGGIEGKVTVPVGAARFPKEIVRLPRALLEDAFNIVWWSEMGSGGHFAALESAESLIEDVRGYVHYLSQKLNVRC